MQSLPNDAKDRPRGRRFLTCGEIARELGCHRSTVTRLIQRGCFPAILLGEELVAEHG
jgi:excisionase family DNA binding protein